MISSAIPSSGDEKEVSLHDLLNQCATNLCEKVEEEEIGAAYGRTPEVEQILTSLASPLKGRILVTGAPRVGKTAIMNDIARRIKAGDCPEALKGSELWALSARSILRAFGVQGWQEKLGQLMHKWGERPDIILYIDALPSTLAAGATMDDPFDMAQFLLGQLQSSNNRILAEGRTQAVRQFLDVCPEYKHILLEVKISEPEVKDAYSMLTKACDDLAISQGITVEPQAIEMALDLTRRFSLKEVLPGKAIDLIGEGIALLSEKTSGTSNVTADDVVTRFGEKTGLPPILLSDEEPYDEQAVRRHFSDRVLGQEQAVDAVVQSLSLLRTRLNNPNRPMGVFLFIGPTGVGKTELARALSKFLFGSDDVIVRFNMSDYSQEWDIQTLFGNPHGFDPESRRGLFTSRLQEHAFAVILLDEFEKAHPDVFGRFLQLFDEGMLINGASETVNLRNSIVILTSNFGARMLSSSKLGFGPAVTVEDRERLIREEMVRFFSPELINRIDSVSFFKPLTKPVLREIAYRRVQEILQREGIVRRDIDVEVDEEVIEWVVEHGYSERYGARYLARQIEKAITHPLAQQLIRNAPPEGSSLRLFQLNGRVASALALPTDSVSKERVAPATNLVDAKQLPRRLNLGDMKKGYPLLQERIEKLEAAHNVSEAREELARLMQDVSTPTFWDNPDVAQSKLQVLGYLSGQVELVDGLRRNLNELIEFLLKVEQEGLSDFMGEAALRYRYIVRELPRAELTTLFSHVWDTYGGYVRIDVKGRRKVAVKWAVDLAKMYLSWAETRGFKAVILSENLDTRIEDRCIWLGIEGYGVYGLLRGDSGSHRLVQSNPSDNAKRQVVQARVVVWPDLPERERPSFDAQKMNVSGRKYSGQGLLLKRITAEVEASIKRPSISMHLFGDSVADDLVLEAKSMLRVASVLHNSGASTVKLDDDPVWGQVVRSYVRYKQNYVQDPRTGLKTGKLKATLNGDIDSFLEAYLRQVALENS